jgi:hypothetical protein
MWLEIGPQDPKTEGPVLSGTPCIRIALFALLTKKIYVVD